MTRARPGASLVAALGAALALGAGVGRAQSVVDVWDSVTIPPPPALEPVTVDSGKTALLITDMYPASCTAQARPSCPGTIPHIQDLLAQARRHKMLVVFTAGLVAQNGPTEPIEALKREPGEPTVRGPADKFFGPDSKLDEILKTAGVQAVIVTGTSADGSVLYTGSEASLRGLKVIVPVDTISSVTRFAELYTVWHLKNTTAAVSRGVTLTRSDLVTIREGDWRSSGIFVLA